MKRYFILKFTQIKTNSTLKTTNKTGPAVTPLADRFYLLFIFIALLAFSDVLLAHGFGERYDLPVPLDLYLLAAALTVLFSFVIIAIFIKGERLAYNYPSVGIINSPNLAYWLAFGFTQLIKLFAIGMLMLIIISGIYGQQNPYENIAPTAVWVIWWVGFSYIAGLLGNLWAVVNPWSSLFVWVEKLWSQVFVSKRFGLHLSWPEKLESWPAVVLFSWFIWAELVWPKSDSPLDLAQIILIYSGITWLGMWFYGRHQWLKNAEVFSILFSFLARFSPTEFRVDCSSDHQCEGMSLNKNNQCINQLCCFENAQASHRHWNLRPWAVGLLTNKALSLSLSIFVLFMLASVTFDGLLATPLWADLAKTMVYSESLRPLIVFLQDYTGNAIAAVTTIALILFLLIFVGIYLVFNALMWMTLPRVQRSKTSILLLSRTFVLSLIPIALAYHLAHYLSYLAIVGQYIIPLISDPMGLEWDLLGTRLYQIDISIINARFVWYTSVVAIVLGHIIAVWLSHVMALRTFRDNRAALLSQIPMLILMVSYTILSLWIMAQPIVEL